MSLARTCDNCDVTIDRETMIEITLRVLKCDQNDEQDAVEEVCGDYCDACITNGGAVAGLLRALEHHRIPEPA